MNPELPDPTEQEPGHAAPGERVRKVLFAALYWLELGLAACTAIVVIIGAFYLFDLLVRHGLPDKLSDFSAEFENVLSAILLLLVGASLAVMLLLRRPESVVEIMFFVIARKILITTHEIYELVLAVAALAALFATKKYLMTGKGSLLKTNQAGELKPGKNGG